MKSVCVELKTRCRYCGNPLIINAITTKIYCKACTKMNAMLEKTWLLLLREAAAYGPGDESTSFIGENQYSLMYHKKNPHCEKCRALIPEDIIKKFSSPGIYKCEECGDDISIRPAPDFLKNKFENLTHIVAEDENMLAEGDGNFKAPEDIEPVIFTCPACGGALEIDGKERMLKCDYCNSNIYLPDDLWFRLHPPKIVKRWYLILK